MKVRPPPSGFYLGDCLQIMPNLPAGSIDLILCDLPYGTTSCRWDTVIPFEDLWQNYNRLLKPNGTIALFAAQPFTSRLISSNLRNYRYSWVWIKNNVTGFAFAKCQPMRKYEDICIFCSPAYRRKDNGANLREPWVYNPQGLKKRDKPIKEIRRSGAGDFVYKGKGLCDKVYERQWTGYPHNVLHFDRDKIRYHPTQKPVALLAYLIKTYTNSHAVVLDNCMGSGSTAVACLEVGNRKFIGIEQDPYYYQIACNRIADKSSCLTN